MKKLKVWHLIVIVFVLLFLAEYRVIDKWDAPDNEATYRLFGQIITVPVLTPPEKLFRKAENSLQDFLFQSKKTIDEKIKLVVIDDESLTVLGQFPWDRSVYARFLDIMAEGKAAAVGLDIIFAENSTNPDADKAFVEAAKKAGNFVAASYGNLDGVDLKTNKIKVASFYPPFADLDKVSTNGHINVIPDPDDSIIRESLNSFIYRKELDSGKFENIKVDSWDIALYKQYLKNTNQTADLSKIKQDVFNKSYIDFIDTANRYSPIPFSKVIDGTMPPDYFEDKIVIVGPYTVGMSKDFYYTSIDKSSYTYGVEIHANIIQNLLNNSFKERLPVLPNLSLLAVLGLCGILICWKFNPLRSGLISIILATIIIGITKYVYFKGYLLSIFFPLILILAIYLAALAYNYILELLEKRRITSIFGRYVAPQVVSQLLEGGEESLKLGGSRRFISVLFVDIRGFTPMSEKAQPEEVVEILNDYLNLTASSIFEFDGTLDKFIGDATMAIFNAPLELPDHAFKAVQAAWAMKQGSYALREKLEKKFGRSVQFGIGVNTGFAVVGNIGSKTRMDYTAIGDTVNTSARLEANAKPGQILLSQATYDLVKGRVAVKPLGEISVKGKTQGIQIYECEGIMPEGELSEIFEVAPLAEIISAEIVSDTKKIVISDDNKKTDIPE